MANSLAKTFGDTMTPTTSHVATDELIETLERLEKGFLLPVSPSWLHDAIRHYARNVEWDMPDDGSALDRYAGSDVATVLNHLPALISALKENQRMREALAFYAAKETWHGRVGDKGMPLEPVATDDGGRRARAALQPQGDAKP